MFDFAQAKIHVPEVALLLIAPGTADHLRSHVDSDYLSEIGDGTGGEERIEPTTATEIEYRLPRQKGGQRDRIATTESEVRSLGNRRKIRF
jgi:hypothetical protein